MEEFRLRALKNFLARPVPTWGVDLSPINFQDFYYYGQPTKETAKKWEDVPVEIRNTFEKLGIPEAERKFLAGVGAVYESQEVYNSLQKDLAKQGVIFTSVRNAVEDYPDLVRKYIGTIVPPSDNKFAALNGAVWSDGPFIYVPEGVKIAMPLQSYFQDQRRRDGPVRADADSRGAEQRGPLHRGVHGCDESKVHAPCGGGRAHSQEGGKDKVHHDTELEQERLQPRDEEGARLRRFERDVAQRRGRLGSEHEVSVDLSAGEERKGRDTLDGVCGCQPGAGHGREGRPPRIRYLLEDHIKVRLEGWRCPRSTGASCTSRGALTT